MGAIDTLLGLLAPPPEQQPPPGGLLGGPQMTPSAMPPMAGPQASPMPMQQAAPQPSMFDRIKERLGGLLDDAKNMGKPGDATEYGGLLSPDDIARAKPGFMARLSSITPGAPTPSQQYHANLNNMVAVHQAAVGAAEQRRILQSRHEMGQLFPTDPNATREQQAATMAQQYNYALSHGDLEMVKDIGQNMRALMAAPRPDTTHTLSPGSVLLDSTGKPLFSNPAGPKAPVMGSPEWKAAEDYRAQLAAKYRVDPQQIIQGADENGTSHFYRVPKNGGPPEMIDGVTPKVTIKSESAQQELTRARAEAAVSEMNNGSQYMHDFEQKLKSGQAKIGNVGQILGSMANTFTHDDPASKAIQNSTLSALNQTNPDLARYIRRALSFAEAESMISSRPSDFRTRMSAFLSQAANGATPDMIDDIESRRNAILTPLNRIYTKAAGAAGTTQPKPTVAAPNAAKRTITADQRDYLRTAKHMTDAEIAQSYTVKP